MRIEMRIVVDDADRGLWPEKPYKANAYDAQGDFLVDAGLGATPLAALRDLLTEMARTGVLDD